MKFSKILTMSSALLLALTPLTTTTILAEESSQVSSVVTSETYSPKQDLYQYVNHEWLATAELTPTSPSVNSFSEVDDRVSEVLEDDMAKILSGDLTTDIPGMDEFVKYYQVVSNFEAREQAGMAALNPIIAPNKEMKTVNDLNSRLIDLFMKDYSTPFTWQVNADLEDAQKNVLYLGSLGIILPDVSYYSNPSASEPIFNAYRSSSLEILKLAGYNDTDAAKLVEDALAFDKLLSQTAMTSTQAAQTENTYNVKTLDEVAAYSKNLDLKAFLTGFLGQTPDKIIVQNTKFFESLDTLFNDETMPLFNAWSIVSNLRLGSNFTTEAARQAIGEYEKIMLGTTEIPSQEDAAYDLAASRYSEVIGLYYGKTYFGEEARQDVTQMIQKIIATYKKRLAANTWLSKATIDNAIKKLDHLTINVGYPDHLPEYYSAIKIDTAKSLIENLQISSDYSVKEKIARLSKPTDPTEWGEAAHTVNAFYSPQNNSIYFPAGFLQAPFYSKEQTVSQNYGAIGAVIGHEISHAFDSEGSQFDEKGNLKNWWTDADYAAFKEKTQAMIDQWNELSLDGIPVNGELTVTENTADAGGLSVALETLKEIEGANLQEFFLHWAQTWREKVSPEYLQLMMQTDTHAPSPLRANVVPSNLEDFYTTFDIQPGDPMYRAPEKRVSIW